MGIHAVTSRLRVRTQYEHVIWRKQRIVAQTRLGTCKLMR